MSATQDFENPWRPIYEWRQTAAWFIAAIGTAATTRTIPLPPRLAMIFVLICFGVALYRLRQAWSRVRFKDAARPSDVTFIELEDVLHVGALAGKKSQVWFGKGYPWSDMESGLMHQLIAGGVAKQIGVDATMTDGAYWLQGLAPVGDNYLDLSLLAGHTLVGGTTGVGKTRGFELLAIQAIARGEPVIIIDPKGDDKLPARLMHACALLGRPEAFVYFHPAHPEQSFSIDPLRNWNRHTELASRIAALIPSETGADPFTAFGWKVLNDIVGGLAIIGQRPNLVTLRRYIEGGPDELLLRTLRAYFSDCMPTWETDVTRYTKRSNNSVDAQQALLDGYINYYRDIVVREHRSLEVDGLISTQEHNREHFQKMIASLIPVLSMLTSGPLEQLLSPDFSVDDGRPATDMGQIVRNNMVAYIGLDSLSDGVVGSAIGSVFMAEATAVAGDIFNYGGAEGGRCVNLFVDESAEVMNKPTIQLLNKGRGAGFRLFIAAQTFADFEARLGSDANARQVLANTNNKILFRVLDSETQKYVTDGIPTIEVGSVSVMYGHSIDNDLYAPYGAAYREQSAPKDADLIPPGIFGSLPSLHYFARLAGGQTLKGFIPVVVDEAPDRAKVTLPHKYKRQWRDWWPPFRIHRQPFSST